MFTKEVWESVGKYGFATIAAMALGLVLYQVVIVPYQTAQEQSQKEAAEERAAARLERAANAKALAESAKEVTSSNVKLADAAKQFADSYKTLADGQSAQVQILKEIRDEQRYLPAIREATAKEPRPEQP